MAFVIPSTTNAAELFSEDFESYSNGTWLPDYGTKTLNTASCTQEPTIQGSVVHEGTKALQTTRTSTGKSCTWFYWDQEEALTQDFLVGFAWRTTGAAAQDAVQIRDSNGGYFCSIRNKIGTTGNIETEDGTTVISSVSTDTWYEIGFFVDFVNQECTYFNLLTGIESGVTKPFSSNPTNADRLVIQTSGAPNHTTYIDTIEFILLNPLDVPPTITLSQSTYSLEQVPLISGMVNSNVPVSSQPHDTYGVQLFLYDASDNLISSWSVEQNVSCENYCAAINLTGQPIIAGSYKITAASCFLSEAPNCSAESEPFEFTITAYGGGYFTPAIPEEVSDIWGGTEEIGTFFGSYPSKQTLYGDCDTTANPLTWLDCLFEWFLYLTIPNGDATVNALSIPTGVLLTRWPLTYVSEPIKAIHAGYSISNPGCIFPDLPSVQILSSETPSFPICQVIADASPAETIDGNAFYRFVFSTMIYAAAFFALYGMATKIFKPE